MNDAVRVKPNNRGEIESQLISWDANQAVETHRTVVKQRINDLLKVLGNPKVPDLMMKACSRDKKAGRLHLHPVSQFSVLKNGKRHSQCRVCRVEQSCEWCIKKKEARKAYHKEYRKTYKTPENPKKYVRKELSDILIAVKN